MAEEHPRPARGPARRGRRLLSDRGRGLALSAEAYRFHLYALTDSAVAGCSAPFPPLCRGAPGRRGRVCELLVHGLWESTDGGYSSSTRSACHVVATYADATRIASLRRRFGPFPDDANPGFCARSTV